MRYPAIRAALMAASASLALGAFMGASPAATLMVGSGYAYKTPSAAAAAAHNGNTVEIMPGTYSNCSVWNASNITIMGAGATPTITGGVCQGKGLFVVNGSNVTVKNLAFAGAKDSDGNGAGIRAQGTNLAVVGSKFTSNQDGILTNPNRQSTLTVQGSTFDHNGACVPGDACAHGIYATQIAALKISNSTFTDTQQGHDIKSRAYSTSITNSTITDGPTGTSSYLVDIPNGGALTMTGDTLEKGPKTSNSTTAISIGEEGASNPAGKILVEDNAFRNDGPATDFVRNKTTSPAQLAGNLFSGNKITPLWGPGTTTTTTATTPTAMVANTSLIATDSLSAAQPAVPQTFTANTPALQAGAQQFPADVPEPATLWLVGTTLLALAWMAGRKRVTA